MCGICGIVSFNTSPPVAAVRNMTVALRHRGPDAHGMYEDSTIALGHARLSVIDLHQEANQPMQDATGRYHLVFNGEIYNFREIRKELEKKGVRFRTSSDTEVLLEALLFWQQGALSRFNGMFSFALWDKQEQTLFCGRDRVGKKPFFYYPHPDGGISFASELKALLQDERIPRTLSHEGLNQFISLNYLLGETSMLQGVKKLKAGEWIMLQRGKGLQKGSYWNLAHFFQNKKQYASESEAIDAFNELMEDAVRLRMISDVPLGAFLSGGVDSSSIVAAMARLTEPQKVKTFSIGFQEEGYSELEEARQMAEYLHVPFHELVVKPDMAELLPEIVSASDEPFADTSVIPTYYLSHFTRSHVTVALSGDGGDELFAGYETYSADKLHHLAGVFRPLCGVLLRSVSSFIPTSRGKVSLDYKLRQFAEGLKMNPASAHHSWRAIFSEREKKELLNDGFVQNYSDAASSLSHFLRYDKEVAGCHYLDRAMYVDIKTWLTDDILVKVDRASMAHSLEVRAPFLDHRLIEFAASLPVEMKMKGFMKKYLLKKSQEAFLPDWCVKRRKSGFNAPVSHWLDSSLAPLLEELISKKNDTISSFSSPQVVKQLFREHQAEKADHGLKLFGLLCLHLWMKQFRISV